MKAKLGMSPIAWWNDDLVELSDDVSLEECLRQSRSAGFTGMEKGRRFPDDPDVMLPILRAADVTLKERRKLILVPRETPMSLVHLRNLVAVTEAGATVLPAAPGFYHRPTQVAELVDFIVQRILDQLDLDITMAPRWEGE